MVFTSSRARGVQKLAAFLLLALATAPAALAVSGFTAARRVGFSPGDQWEPALATDAHGHIYILFPQYGPVAQCPACTAPTMVLLVSSDNGTSWEAPHSLLASSLGQFDAQIKVDPNDGQTLYASWMQGRHVIIVARSQDFGRSWSYAVAEQSPEIRIDKPVLAVRGPNVYVSFNHDQTLAVAASHDYAQTFSATVLNPNAETG
ncbi:MAG TPA: exo-alpha-sialidase, partial [Candidatus Sulfotelmatobacter sp.]|nr:exo-alpha-sialidase [Candidatus Sulfotelmatobacter sp.]